MKLLVSWSKGSLPWSDFALLDRRESGHDIYARRGILSHALSTLPTIVVEHFLSFWQEIRSMLLCAVKGLDDISMT